MKGRVLIIAGSDSGGGAGIQGDIKTVTSLNSYAATAITAITVQNTRTVEDVHGIPPATIAAQIRVVLEDIGADAIKTGMLHDADVIQAVVGALDAHGKNIPLIVDPVMISKSGASLLQEQAVAALKTKLLPRAFLITPNLPEAETLLGRKITSLDDMRVAARDLASFGSRAVLLKGGHMPSPTITDILWDGTQLHEWQNPRLDTRHTHGTGCTLASAISSFIAQKAKLREAIEKARAYVQGALLHAPGLGTGNGPLNHMWMQGE